MQLQELLKCSNLIRCALDKNLEASQMALVLKNQLASIGDLKEACPNLGSGRSPGGGNDNPLLYSCL